MTLQYLGYSLYETILLSSEYWLWVSKVEKGTVLQKTLEYVATVPLESTEDGESSGVTTAIENFASRELNIYSLDRLDGHHD